MLTKVFGTMLLSQKLRAIFDYFMITVGSLVAAVGLGVFLVEADVVPGGVTGVSMIANFIWPGLPVGTLVLVLNIPLFIWGIIELGNSFGVRTLYGFASNAIFIDILRDESPLLPGYAFQNTDAMRYLMEHEFFFAVLIGSILTGIGLGTIFKFKGTTAGTEIICAILKKRFGISPGMSMMCVDFFVISAATVVLYVQDSRPTPAVVLACYALFSLYVSSLLLDKVVYGFDYARNMMIFSKKNGEISKYIMEKLDRGVTAFYARGMYTNEDREVLMTIVSPSDARQLAPYIRELDPGAFLTVTNVNEVLGEGFRSREEFDLKLVRTMEKREAERAAAVAAQEALRAEMRAEALRGGDGGEEAERAASEAAELRARAVSLESAAASIRSGDTYDGGR